HRALAVGPHRRAAPRPPGGRRPAGRGDQRRHSARGLPRRRGRGGGTSWALARFWERRLPAGTGAKRWVMSRLEAGVPRSALRSRHPAPRSTSMPDALLSLRGVQTHVGRYHILHGVDFDVPAGGLTMLLGRNGAGKTTTLRTIMGLWRASSGEIRFDGRD